MTGGKTFQVEIGLQENIEQLKKLCEQESGIICSEMRVIYKGRILKDQESLKEKNIQTGDSIHIVKGQAQTQQQQASQQQNQQQIGAPQTLSSGAGNMAGLMPGINSFGVMSQVQNMMQDVPDINSMGIDMNPQQIQQMQQVLQNPMMRQMMLNMMQNPQTMDMIANMNPQLRQLIDQHPGMREMLTSPQVMQQAMQMMDMMGRNTGGSGTMTGQPGTFPSPGQSIQQQSAVPASGQPVVSGQVQLSFQQGVNIPVPQYQQLQSGANPQQEASVQQQQIPAQQPISSLQQQSNQQEAQQQVQQPQQPTISSQTEPSIQVPQQQQQGQMPQFPQFNPAAIQQMQQMLQNFQNLQSGQQQQQPQGQTGQQPQNAPQQPQIPMFNPFQSFPMTLPVQQQQAQNLEVLYATQLQKLEEMGFTNKQVNLEALKITGGNVEAAIERLFNMMG